MTAGEAISLVDNLRPNQYDSTLKLKWLNKLDGQIFREVIQTHEGCAVYSPREDMERELIVPFPYAEDVYCNFLQAMIDKENGEIGKYNQAISLFQTAYTRYCNWYNRTTRPINPGRFLF